MPRWHMTVQMVEKFSLEVFSSGCELLVGVCLHQRLATVGRPIPTSVSLVLRGAAIVSAVRLRQLTGGTLCQALVCWSQLMKEDVASDRW